MPDIIPYATSSQRSLGEHALLIGKIMLVVQTALWFAWAFLPDSDVPQAMTYVPLLLGSLFMCPNRRWAWILVIGGIVGDGLCSLAGPESDALLQAISPWSVVGEGADQEFIPLSNGLVAPVMVRLYLNILILAGGASALSRHPRIWMRLLLIGTAILYGNELIYFSVDSGEWQIGLPDKPGLESLAHVVITFFSITLLFGMASARPALIHCLLFAAFISFIQAFHEAPWSLASPPATDSQLEALATNVAYRISEAGLLLLPNVGQPLALALLFSHRGVAAQDLALGQDADSDLVTGVTICGGTQSAREFL